ncbi:MAG TPA: hypothetical protein VK828_17870 [Terriglobales bacterium]|jgi:hypothetical protein|nr:hypothetical protein [Terriglobales bacterium]
MRSAALIVAILWSSLAFAKDYEWKEGKVIDITTEKRGAVVVPIASLVGGPSTKTFYWIQTADTVYALGPVIGRRQLLNVTLHEPTKIAIDGKTAHIVDDYGQDRKMPIAEKVARPKSENPR